MDKDRFSLPGAREHNPLRPYYIPPSIGIPNIPTNNTTGSQAPRSAGARVASSSPLDTARDYLPDIDLDLKATTGEAWQNTRALFDTLVWRYTSVLLAQPFDVAKTLLQVSHPQDSGPIAQQKKRGGSGRATPQRRKGRAQHPQYSDEDEDSPIDSDEDSDADGIPEYFSATAPRSRSPRRRRRAPPSDEDASPSPTPRPSNRRSQTTSEQNAVVLLKDPSSILSAISALHSSSGTVGLWRATNTTFLYAILLRTTESFLRSLLLTIIGLPEIIGPDQSGLAPGLSTPGGAGFSGIDISDSPSPFASLLVVGLSSGLTGLLLAPLDLVRTRLLLTPMHHAPRGLVQNLRRLPSLLAPRPVWTPTVLYHTLPNVFSALAPIFLRSYLYISPDLAPNAWSLAAFATSLLELFLRLPLETLLRRSQVAALQQQPPTPNTPAVPLIIAPAPYLGVMGTVYSILYVEGETSAKLANGMLRRRKGQGWAGLIRGWRVGFWGLVGVQAAAMMGPGEPGRRNGSGEF